jgi:hypothetical protein
LEYERAERLHESERRKEEAARAKERQRRDLATAKAAEREHDGIATAIEAERAALEKRSQADNARWEKQRQKLDLAVHRARNSSRRRGVPQGAPARAAVAPRQSNPDQDKKI